MQKCSLEWFYRLIQNPRRLFSRYFVTNNKYIYFNTIKRNRYEGGKIVKKNKV